MPDCSSLDLQPHRKAVIKARKKKMRSIKLGFILRLIKLFSYCKWKAQKQKPMTRLQKYISALFVLLIVFKANVYAQGPTDKKILWTTDWSPNDRYIAEKKCFFCVYPGISPLIFFVTGDYGERQKATNLSLSFGIQREH
jgi:hypothetical protein